MIGLIQQVLVKLIEDRFGLEAVQTVFKEAGVPPDQQYRIDVNYSDEECVRLIKATCAVAKLSESEVFEVYADYFLRYSRAIFPKFYEISSNSKEFLKRQPTIHNCFGVGLRSQSDQKAIADKFQIEEDGESLITTYDSPNMLCGLYVALAKRVIHEYGDEVIIEELSCTRNGDSVCRIRLTWTAFSSSTERISNES